MMSSHSMMAFLVIVGYVTIIATIVIAVLEAKRMDKGKRSLLSGSEEKITGKK